MRRARPLLATALLSATACSSGGTDPAPPAPPAAEVPRPAVELLVQRFGQGGQRSFYTMAPDGTGVAPFPAVPGDTRAAVPSPDGRTIALLRETGDDVHLWLLDRLGGALTPVLIGVRVVHAVSWSPDGARLAVAQSTDTVTEDVFVMARDGSGAVDLTPDPLPAISFDRLPAWSPDGTTIAFASNRSGTTRLWRMDPDGGNLRQVTAAITDSRERSAAWSPDGSWLAFSAETLTGEGVVAGVGVVRPDGSGYRTFEVNGPFTSVGWSPDGRVLHAGARSGDWEVYALDVGTGVTTNLTRHLAQDVDARPLRWVAPPAWSGLAAPSSVDAGAPSPGGLVAADLDGDGDLDLAVLAPSRGQVRLLRNEGGGAFTAVGGLDTLDAPHALAAGDVSLDGVADLVVAGGTTMQVFRGGPGLPGAPTEHALTGEPRAVAAADFGGDGAYEAALVVARGDAAPFHAQLYATNGAGELVPVVDAPVDLAGAGAACPADATGEGWIDLLVLLAGPGPSVAVVPGQGPSFGASFEAAAGLGLGAGAQPVCADLDGDRREDLVLVGTTGVRVLRWDGDRLGAPVSAGVAGTGAAAGDLDRDGDVDLVVAGPGGLAWLRNLGDGTFAAPATLVTPGLPARVIAADLDGDGWLDLAVAGEGGEVSVLGNKGR